MRLADLTPQDFRQVLATRGLCFPAGPFVIRLRSDLADFADTLRECYGALPVLDDDQVAHFRIGVHRNRGLRKYFSSQAVFTSDGREPFAPYPLSHAFPLFEWGLNWCIAMTAHTYLMLHSAVVARDDRAVILPAMPGSGKSTLCAALVGRGWRLLSDEFGIVRHTDGVLLPLPRAAPLKDGSIEVIRRFSPDARLGPLFTKTRKGNVVHLFPPEKALLAHRVPAQPALIVFPKYAANRQFELLPQAPSEAFTRLVNNSFNYQLTGEAGFRTLCSLVRQAPALQLKYSELDDAIAALERELRALDSQAAATSASSPQVAP